MKLLRMMLAAASGIFLTTASLPAAAQSAPAPDKILYQSTNRTLAELDRDITALYLKLHNAGRMTVQLFLVGPEDRSIQQILRQQGLYFGPTLPVELDSIVCDLNTHFCARPWIEADKSVRTSLTKHVTGFKPSSGRWRLAPGLMILPAIKFEVFNDWEVFQKQENENIKDIVETVTGGCTSFDEACRQEILRNNFKLGSEIFRPEFSGTVVLPVKTVRAEIDLLPADTASSDQDTSQQRPNSKSLVLQPSGDSNEKGGNNFKVKEQAATPPRQMTAPGNSEFYRVLQPNTVGGIRGTVQASSMLFEEDFGKYNKKQRDLIKFRYRNAASYPDDLQGDTPVAVLDRKVDPNHCALPPSRISVNNLSLAANAGTSTVQPTNRQCNMLSDGAVLDEDHGTHIVGIIGGKDHPNHPVGLNPFARIYATEIDFRAISSPGQFNELNERIKSLIIGKKIEVVNMSFGYMLESGGIDLLEATMRRLIDTLFVVAAGNFGSDKTNICDLRPTCFNFPNVISVAALDNSPDKPKLLTTDGVKKYSNYGSTIHIAAPGEQIFSTISNDKYGLMSGTSQAAPQVSAVASLLFSKSKLKPVAVKNRLIACSSHIGELRPSLYAGRVDAECTLDNKFDRIEARNDVLYRGELRQARILFTTRKSRRKLEFTDADLAAIHYDSIRQSYVVYYHSNYETKDSTVLRETDLQLDDPNATLSFEPDQTGAPIPISVKDIVRFVAATK